MWAGPSLAVLINRPGQDRAVRPLKADRGPGPSIRPGSLLSMGPVPVYTWTGCWYASGIEEPGTEAVGGAEMSTNFAHLQFGSCISKTLTPEITSDETVPTTASRHFFDVLKYPKR